MEIKTRHIGGSASQPSRIIELTFENESTEITVDITGLNGFVDVNFIENLKALTSELEEHNKELESYKNAITNTLSDN